MNQAISLSIKRPSDHNSADESVLAFVEQELRRYLPRLLADSQDEVELTITLELDAARFERDAYRVARHSTGAKLQAGGARGLLHAVYELFRSLGASFLFPGARREFIPQLRYWPRESWDRERRPIIEYRGLCFYNCTAKTLAETLDAVDWMAKNGYNFLLTSIHREDDTGLGSHAILWDEIGDALLPEIQKRGIVLDMSEHSTDYYFPKETIFSQQPEWFSLLDGQRRAAQICYSNPEAVEAYAESLADFVKDKAYFQFFGIWPLDGGDYCECEGCKDPLTLYRANLRIAARLAEVRPDLVMEHLAYTPQSFARPSEDLPPQLAVLVCNERNHIAYEWAQKAKNGGGAFYFEYHSGDHYRFRSNVRLNPVYLKETVNCLAGYGFRGIVSLYLPLECYWQSSINYWYLREFYNAPCADIKALNLKLASELLLSESGVAGAHSPLLAKILNAIVEDLHELALWGSFPFKHEWQEEHFSRRNRELDESRRLCFEARYVGLREALSELRSAVAQSESEAKGDAERPLFQLSCVERYLSLQNEYFKAIELYDAERDTPARVEPYFAALAECAALPDNPFIGEAYARWRICGRDNIFAANGQTAFEAQA